MSPILPVDAVLPASASASSVATSNHAAGFAQWIVRETENANRSLVNADLAVRQLAAGTAPNLHEVMIRLEEAKLSLQLLAAVRSNVLEAYQEIMRTQV